MICAKEECDRPIYAKHLCKKHYTSSWFSANPGRYSEARKKYREANSEKTQKARRSIGGRFSSGKIQAKRRGVLWTIGIDHHEYLLSLPCHWCDGDLNETGSCLNRLDNKKGYEQVNVVPSCHECNTTKGRIESLGFPYPRAAELMNELMKLRADSNMKKNHDIITLECTVKHETEKAYLIEGDMGEAWFPKSAVDVERATGQGGADVVQLPEWMAIDKGII